MTDAEARQLIFSIESIYNRSVGDGRDIWVRSFMRAEREPARAVVERWANGVGAPERLPILPDVMQAFRSESRRRDAETERSSLIPPDPTVVPDWVLARQVLRKRGDMRAFPEQEPAYREQYADWMRLDRPDFAEIYAWPPPEGVISKEEEAELLAQLRSDAA